MHPRRHPILQSAQLGQISGFGPVLGVFRVSSFISWISAIFGAILVFGAGLVICYGVFDTIVQIARYGISINQNIIIIPVLIATCLFIPGALAWNRALVNWNKQVVVYQKGLVYTDGKGSQIWHWQDIEWFFVSITKNYLNGIHTNTNYLYTIQSKNGHKLKLDQKFKHIERLGDLIGKHIFAHQYTKLHNQLINGQTLKLGKLTIDKASLKIGKKSFSWDEVDYIKIKDGFFWVKKKEGAWFNRTKIPVSSIPNLDALLTLLTQMIELRIDK